MRTNLISIAGRAAIASVAILFAAAMTPAASAAQISYIYGIDDNNDIWELDPVGQTATNVFSANGKGSPFTISGTGNSNAFAYDKSKENMFFLNGSGTSSNLYVWNKPTNTLTVAATAAQLNITSGSLQPANAAFNPTDGKYYFFEDGTADLYSIDFTYSGNTPSFSSSNKVTVSGIVAGDNLYGDIAIDNGSTPNLLYGSTTNGDFFSIDLNQAASSYNPIDNNGLSPQTGLQLSFDASYNTLYGQVFGTKQWYVVNLADASVGSSIWTSPVAFRDLGGASFTSAPPSVPEIDPTALGSMLTLLLGLFGLVERRRLAILA